MDDKTYAENYILPNGQSLAERRHQDDQERLYAWGEQVLPCLVEGSQEDQALKALCFEWMMTSVDRDDSTVLSFISMLGSDLESSSVSWYSGKSSGVSGEQRARQAQRGFNHLYTVYKAGYVTNAQSS